MKLFNLLMLLIPIVALSQEIEVKQRQFLLVDVKNNFSASIDSLKLIDDIDSGRIYTSKIKLLNSKEDDITIGKDGKYYAIYTAFINDSCSHKDAKRLAEHWRLIAKTAAPNFSEEKMNDKNKTFSGHPFYGYVFTLIEGGFKYWIDVSFAERPSNKGYSVIFSLGRQMWFSERN